MSLESERWPELWAQAKAWAQERYNARALPPAMYDDLTSFAASILQASEEEAVIFGFNACAERAAWLTSKDRRIVDQPPSQVETIAEWRAKRSAVR